MNVRSLKIDLLNHCNARCPFCPYHGEEGSVTRQLTDRREPYSALELRDFGKLADQCDTLGMRPQFKFSGRGEATVHRSFSEIIRFLAARGYATRLITNGLRLERHAQVLADCATGTIVSIHGAPAVHDAVIGRPGARAAAEHGIRVLRRLGGNVSVAIIMTPENLPELNKLVAGYAAAGVPVRVHHNFDAAVRRALDSEDVAAAVKRVCTAYPGVSFIPNLSETFLQRYYGPEAFVLAPHACARYAEELEIASDGTASVCDSGPLGNIRRESLRDILEGAACSGFLATVREELASAGGLSPARCDRCCYQAAPAA